MLFSFTTYFYLKRLVLMNLTRTSSSFLMR